MPYLLAFNRRAVEERLARLAGYIGLADASYDGFLAWIVELRRHLAIPHRLSDLGVAESDLDRIAAMAEADPSAGGNPLRFGAPEARSVLDAARAGDCR